MATKRRITRLEVLVTFEDGNNKPLGRSTTVRGVTLEDLVQRLTSYLKANGVGDAIPASRVYRLPPRR